MYSENTTFSPYLNEMNKKKEEDKTFTITLYANQKRIRDYVAKNVSGKHGLEYGYGLQIYEINNTKHKLEHYFEDGAEVLAHKILTYCIKYNL